MILVILLPSINNTGPSKGAIALANMFADELEVYFVTLKKNKRINSLNKNVKLIELNSNKWNLIYWITAYRNFINNLKQSRKVISLSMCFSADLVNTFTSDLCFNISSLRSNLKKDYYYKYNILGYILSYFHYLMLKRFKLIISMSIDMKNNIKKYNTKVITIHNFIDEPNIKKIVKNKTNRSKKIIIIYLGSLINRKSPETLIDISKKLKKDKINFSLNIYGDGKLFKKINNLIKKNDLTKEVFLKGHIYQPYSEIINSDIMIMPSYSEGISRATLEALFLGVPCIMRDVDANNELITDNVNGYLFKNLNNIDLKILDLYKLRNKTSGNYLLPKKFTFKFIKNQYLELFNSIKEND